MQNALGTAKGKGGGGAKRVCVKERERRRPLQGGPASTLQPPLWPRAKSRRFSRGLGLPMPAGGRVFHLAVLSGCVFVRGGGGGGRASLKIR